MPEGLSPHRKQLRVGHKSERGAINAVRGLLEAHGLVVDEVDGRSDYGRDLNVDITDAFHVTGGIIGIQVKGGKSYFRSGQWVIPATPTDWEYWRASTVPIVGMVWDPETSEIRWVNLSQLARSEILINEYGYDYQLQSDEQPEVAVATVLNDETFNGFLNSVETYLQATTSSAFLELLADDDEVRRHGIFNCWTLGRRDPRPLILLRRLLPTFSGQSLMDGIAVLSHATAHPDILWSPRNWISEPIEVSVKKSFRWTSDEIVTLVHKVESLDPDFTGWSRGGVGQSLFLLLLADPERRDKLRRAVKHAVEERKVDAAARLLICYQWTAEHPAEDTRQLLTEVPELLGHQFVNWLLDALDREGLVDPIA